MIMSTVVLVSAGLAETFALVLYEYVGSVYAVENPIISDLLRS